MFLRLCLALITICLFGCGADEPPMMPTEPAAVDDSIAPTDIPTIALVEIFVDDFKAKDPTIFFYLLADRPLAFDVEVYVEIQNELTDEAIQLSTSPMTISKGFRNSEIEAFGFGRWSVEFSVNIIPLEEVLERLQLRRGLKLKPYKLGTPSQLFHSRKEQRDENP